jgi:hypothetical protein
VAAPQYTVMVDDNFHYMDQDERWQYGTFASADEAIAACRHLVEQSLTEHYKPGMTAGELCAQYTSFGDDPFVIAPEGCEKVSFSARDYASERAEAMCTQAPGAAS